MRTSGKVIVWAAVLAGAFFALQVRAAELIMFNQAYCEWCEAWEQDIGVIYDKTEEGKRAPVRRVMISTLAFVTGFTLLFFRYG